MKGVVELASDTEASSSTRRRSACDGRGVPPSSIVIPALDYERARVPLYTIPAAAKIVSTSPRTFETWANGYVRQRGAGRPPTIGAAVITRLPSSGGRASIPFIGLAEAYALRAFRNNRIPMPRVRAAIEHLVREVGLEHALAHERLFMLGPRLLYDYADAHGDAELMDLVDLEAGQRVFAQVVRQHLEGVIRDEDGWAMKLRVKRYEVAEVYVDVEHSSGAPYFAKSGVSVQDVLGRYTAGDPVELLADDYGIPVEEVAEVAGSHDRAA